MDISILGDMKVEYKNETSIINGKVFLVWVGGNRERERIDKSGSEKSITRMIIDDYSVSVDFQFIVLLLPILLIPLGGYDTDFKIIKLSIRKTKIYILIIIQRFNEFIV